MLETIYPYLLGFLVLIVILGLLKIVLKITSKLFKWGCLILILIGGIMIFLGDGIAFF